MKYPSSDKKKKSPSSTLAVCGNSSRALNRKMTESQNVCNGDGYQSTLKNYFHAPCSLEFPPLPCHLDVKRSYTCGSSVKGHTSSSEITLEIPSYGCYGTVEWEVILHIKCVSIQHPFWTGKMKKALCFSQCLLYSRQGQMHGETSATVLVCRRSTKFSVY